MVHERFRYLPGRRRARSPGHPGRAQRYFLKRGFIEEHRELIRFRHTDSELSLETLQEIRIFPLFFGKLVHINEITFGVFSHERIREHCFSREGSDSGSTSGVGVREFVFRSESLFRPYLAFRVIVT